MLNSIHCSAYHFGGAGGAKGSAKDFLLFGFSMAPVAPAPLLSFSRPSPRKSPGPGSVGPNHCVSLKTSSHFSRKLSERCKSLTWPKKIPVWPSRIAGGIGRLRKRRERDWKVLEGIFDLLGHSNLIQGLNCDNLQAGRVMSRREEPPSPHKVYRLECPRAAFLRQEQSSCLRNGVERRTLQEFLFVANVPQTVNVQAEFARTACPSGLRGWTQVPVAQAEWGHLCACLVFVGVACLLFGLVCLFCLRCLVLFSLFGVYVFA